MAMELLLIDDNQDDRQAIIQILLKADSPINITQAECANDALNCVAKYNFDCILLDEHFPDMGCVDVIRVLNNGCSSNTAIIIISTEARALQFEKSIESGAQDFVIKSDIDIGRLSYTVKQTQYQLDLQRELMHSQEKMRELTEYDLLTDLSNRYRFELCLARAVFKAKCERNQIAVLLLDIDDFKSVNDTFGHRKGDLLLTQLAERLSGTKRKHDILFRLSADEFVVLATDLDDPGYAYTLAKRLLMVFNKPFFLGEAKINVSASIGIATLSETNHSVSELMKCADMAMCRGKKRGRNQIQFYSESLHHEVRRRRKLESDLRQAIAKQELEVYYQAQISAKDGSIVGAEALLRWQHSSDGMIMPGEFLPIAEETGLIEPIGEWVLRTACSQVAAWNKQLSEKKQKMRVAVNLSALQIKSEKLFDVVTSSLRESGLSASCLELEITESALIESPEKIAVILNKIVAQGVTLALDDFGTGFSSLQHLKYFPIQTLKIDRSFIMEIGEAPRDERLLSALIHFAQAFDVKTVAEGVEDAYHSKFCTDKGCDILQGYYYCMPIPAKKFAKEMLKL